MPSLKHAQTREAGEDAKKWDAACRCHVLARRVVAGIEVAGADDGAESGEGAAPGFDLAARQSRSGDRAFHPLSLFATGAFIDVDGRVFRAQHAERLRPGRM